MEGEYTLSERGRVLTVRGVRDGEQGKLVAEARYVPNDDIDPLGRVSLVFAGFKHLDRALS
jgi:hypothetical protein